MRHSARMSEQVDLARLEEAFERIEETILPCISMVLESMIDASVGLSHSNPKALAAELRTVAAELEELTRAVERSSPVQAESVDYRIAAG